MIIGIYHQTQPIYIYKTTETTMLSNLHPCLHHCHHCRHQVRKLTEQQEELAKGNTGLQVFFSSQRYFCHQIDSYNGTMFPCDKCQSHFSLLLFPEAKSLDNMYNILNWQSRRRWESPRRRWRGRRGGSRLSRSSYSVAR